MKEIEVGEYVRTKDGLIEKIKTINKFGIVTKHDNKNEDTISGGTNYYTENGLEINTEDIAKHSKNIIDLIEVRRYSLYRRCSSRRYSLYNDRKIFLSCSNK